MLIAPLLLAGPAVGADPARLPPALAAAVRPHLVADGVDPGALAAWDEDYARPVDLSPDGVADWVLDFNALGFPGWCGSGGCRHQVWISEGAGYVLALDEWVVEAVPRTGSPRTLDVELHGSFCREPGNAPCARSFAWNARRRALDEVPNAEGASLLTGPLFQPVPTDEAEWPEPVQRLRDATVDRCVESGARELEWSWPASSIPDIDGDGERDWALDEAWLYCGSVDEGLPPIPSRLHVFVSNRGQWTEKLDVPQAEWWIDVSARPASLVVSPQAW